MYGLMYVYIYIYSSVERKFHVAIVWYITTHVSSADVVRSAGYFLSLRIFSKNLMLSA